MWLLRHEIAERLEAARNTITVSVEAQKRFEAKHEPQASGLPRIARTAGSVMEITVEGVLTKNPDILAWLFFGANTAYRDIQDALATAQADSSIKSVVLNIDSPGGHVDGLFDTLGALQAFTKKVDVRASLAASAAYAIAAAAPGKIQATNQAAEFGSIGVAASYMRDESVIDITSTDAPDKRPDVSTEEGKAVVRKHLDAIHELFVDAIASGRGTTVTDVNQNFGRGAVLLAGEAKSRGMIDSIAKPASVSRQSAAATGGTQPRKKRMDEQELKSQHPELYAAVLEKGKAEGLASGKEQGIKEGTEKERARVNAHLKLAESTGAVKFAHEAIASGKSCLDEEVHAEYLSAAMKRRDVDAHTAETAEAEAAVAGAETSGEGPDLQDRIVAVLDAQKGLVK